MKLQSKFKDQKTQLFRSKLENKNFHVKTWEEQALGILYKGLLAKFQQTQAS